MRPVFSASTRRLWRDAQSMQFGRAAQHAVVLAGLDPADRVVLDLLDGTRDLPALQQDGQAAGCPAPRVLELVGMLCDAGLVVDARQRWPQRYDAADRERLAPDAASLNLLHQGGGLATLRRREQMAVLVVGGGRVGAPLACLLASSGVGTVDVLDHGTARPADLAVGGLDRDDLGSRRGDAARARLRRRSPATRCVPVRHPDLAVLTPAQGVDDDRAAVLGDAAAHLVVEVHDTVGVVGPLVVPGRSACQQCLDLTRTDLDPGWPALAAQLRGPAGPAPCDGLLAAAVSVQAAMQVLALLDGEAPATVNGSLELSLPDWRWRRRSWRPHPACGCQWATAV